MRVTFEVAFQALPPSLHRHCTDEAQKAETVLSAVIYIYIYIYIYLLKTQLRILDFQHFLWLAGHRLSAHIPALPNMVNESINKESWIKNFPRNWRPLKSSSSGINE